MDVHAEYRINSVRPVKLIIGQGNFPTRRTKCLLEGLGVFAKHYKKNKALKTVWIKKRLASIIHFAVYYKKEIQNIGILYTIITINLRVYAGR